MTGTRKPVDAVIIGFGWTGAIMAKTLTEAGLNVVAFERGPLRRSGAVTPRPAVWLGRVPTHRPRLDTGAGTAPARTKPGRFVVRGRYARIVGPDRAVP